MKHESLLLKELKVQILLDLELYCMLKMMQYQGYMYLQLSLKKILMQVEIIYLSGLVIFRVK